MLLLSSLLLQPLSALEIVIDYSFDTTNFFNTPERRNAMEAVADFYGDIIQDNLLEIDNTDFPSASWTASFSNPTTGNTQSISNLFVPEDTIIIYVGARDLGGNVIGQGGPGGFGLSGFQSWFTRVFTRGQSGIATGGSSANNTDFSLWGGSIAFDEDTNWNFSLEQNQNGIEFITTALHEMGHVLGVGTAATWNNQISGGVFTGLASAQSHGSAPPADFGHFLSETPNPTPSTLLSSPRFGSFNNTHGTPSNVTMLATLFDNGSAFNTVTDLDLAALIDIGWQISPPASFANNFNASNLNSTSSNTFSWPSSSFFSYQLTRSSNLVTFPGISPIIAGNGSTQSFSDNNPLPSRAFYRLQAINRLPSAALLANATQSASSNLQAATTSNIKNNTFRSAKVEPKHVDNCNCIELHSR